MESDPKHRVAAGEKEGLHDRRTGQFGTGNSAGTGGLAGWQKELRGLLKEDARDARALLRRVARGEDVDGQPDKEIQVRDQIKAAETILRFTLPLPKQTHRVEGKGGDPLAMLTSEALVAFIVSKKQE